jgi:gliding motility-associated-like protein
MKKIYSSFIIATSILASGILKGQVPTCDPTVPFYQVNLAGQPGGIWYSPGHVRQGNCCGTSSPDRCTSFEITLDTLAAMINFNIASGAVPTGAMFYQIGCGPQIPVGQPICIVGPGPHRLTFCKPGNNQNTYFVQSIAQPFIPSPQYVRIGCSKQINVLGLDTASVVWNSIAPGLPGQYNSYLSCTNGCVNPTYTPPTNAPAYVDYVVCGTPLATICGYTPMCDTVRIYNQTPLSVTVNPNPASFCASGTGVTLTATGSGGYGAYSYIWTDQSSNVVGTSATYTATGAGIYSVEVRDALYNVFSCPAEFESVPVIVSNVPIVSAGADQSICASSPETFLNASFQYATGITWSGGNGTFNPNNTSIYASYTPTPAELAAGSVTLTITTNGSGGGCTAATDNITITYPPVLNVTFPNTNVPCNTSTISIAPTVSGGTAPYTYEWNTGATTSSITGTMGNYCVSVTDAIGCNAIVCGNVLAPPMIGINISSTDATANGASDGSATAAAYGGAGSYTYVWSPGGQTGSGASGLAYGVYTVTVTDANGCSMNASIVVNEPRCAAFDGTVKITNVLCAGNMNGDASVFLSGGTPPYSIQWNDPSAQTGASAINLGAGTYEVLATDSNGCNFAQTITITQPAQLTNVMNSTNVTTGGGSNGTATANPFGGTQPYTFNWNTGGTTQMITGLSAGTYVLNLSDTNNCQVIDSVMILDAPCQNLVLASSATSVSCNGANDGSAFVIALHGDAPYTYSWSNGATSATASNLAAGTYVVTVTDANNCSAFKNIIVTEPQALSIALAPTAISCFNQNDGTIELSVAGGTFPYYYSWSNSISVEDQAYLSDGTYSVTVTDANGCSANGSATIVRPAEITMTYTNTAVTCNSGSDASIDITVNGGILPYNFSWNNGEVTEDLSSVQSGQYIPTVTDANGCSLTLSLGILIDQPAPVAALSYSVSCPVPGSGVAEVDVTPTGGWQSSYQLSFDDGVNFQTAGDYDILLPVNATYTVVIRDSNGCISPLPIVVSINPELSISAINFNSCFYEAGASGQVDITPSGGNGGPYSVSLNNGGTFEAQGDYSFSVASDSTYSVIIRDSNSCVSVAWNISLPAPLLATSASSSFNAYNVSCKGMNDGSIDVSISGGTIPYSYAWSNSSTAQDQTSLTAGTYSVVITDGSGCSDTLNITLTEPTMLVSAGITSDYNGYGVSCSGMSDGSIDISVSGGVGPYEYQWSTTDTTEDIIGIPAGTYTAIATDQNNCSDTTIITLAQPAPLNLQISSTSDYGGFGISCNGSGDGAVDLQVSGGVALYSYNWSSGDTTEDLSALVAGSYSVVVTDQNNCSDTLSVNISEPVALAASLVATSDYNGYNISCNGMSDASIDIDVTGGVAAYTYSWSNGSTTQDLSGIAAGAYTVTITDANNCTTAMNFYMIQPDSLSASATVTSSFNGYQVSCNGSTDGAVDLSVNGGIVPYTYTWSNGTTSEDLSGIGAGIYTSTITDMNNCTANVLVNLTQPPALISLILSTSNFNGYEISCSGMADGSADLMVNGGVAAYTYTWSNGATTEDLSGAAAGTYSVIITDQNNCTDTATVTLTEPASLNAVVSATSNFNGSNISCAGASDGSVDVTVSGGVTGYIYNWSNGTGSEDLNGIGAGSYSLTVTDANNCSATLTISLIEPAPLIATGTVTSNFNGFGVSCSGSADGAIDISISGGTAAYNYSWSNGSSAEDPANLAAGTYSVSITDANGCTGNLSFDLSQPAALSITADIQNVLCDGFSTGSINVTVNGGVNPYAYSWSNGSADEDITNATSGAYSVIVTDQNNCSVADTFVIGQSYPLALGWVSADVTCAGQANGYAHVSVSGGTNSYTYNWSNGGTEATISNIPAGTYSVLVTDGNNCTSTISITVTEPDALGITLESPLYPNGFNVSANEGSDGSINATISGGSMPYNFSWSNGAGTEDLFNLSAGLYTLVVTDSAGCTSSGSITLTEPFILAMPNGYSPNGDGDNDFFVVKGIDAYPKNVMTVFNRWGNQVYEKVNYANGWNGKSQAGGDLPDGTYFVILKIDDHDITLTGYVDLRRQ